MSYYFTLYETESTSLVIDLTKGRLFVFDTEKLVFTVPLDPAKIAINFSDRHTDAKMLEKIKVWEDLES